MADFVICCCHMALSWIVVEIRLGFRSKFVSTWVPFWFTTPWHWARGGFRIDGKMQFMPKWCQYVILSFRFQTAINTCEMISIHETNHEFVWSILSCGWPSKSWLNLPAPFQEPDVPWSAGLKTPSPSTCYCSRQATTKHTICGHSFGSYNWLFSMYSLDTSSMGRWGRRWWSFCQWQGVDLKHRIKDNRTPPNT